MTIFDIFIAYIAWNTSGKSRPVIVIENQETVFIDTNIIRDLPKAAWNGKIPIGKLSETDKQRFLEFWEGI